MQSTFSIKHFSSWYQQNWVTYMCHDIHVVFKLYVIFCIFNYFVLFVLFLFFNWIVSAYYTTAFTPTTLSNVNKNVLGLTVTLEIQCRGLYHPPFSTIPCLRVILNSLSIEVKLSTLDWSTTVLPTLKEKATTQNTLIVTVTVIALVRETVQ